MVGAIVQPGFIFGEMFLITGATLIQYCAYVNQTSFLLITPCLASLLLIALLSIERYVVMKYSLRHQEIITKFRLSIAVISCWIAAAIPQIFITITILWPQAILVLVCLGSSSLLAIIYCHISVYFVTRRHMNKIKTEQVSQDAQKKFLEEKKAVKTTSIIIGFAALSFLPMLVFRSVRPVLHDDYLGNFVISLKPLCMSFTLVNSLCNPIIYCWRSSGLRRAFFELLRKTNNAG